MWEFNHPFFFSRDGCSSGSHSHVSMYVRRSALNRRYA